MLKKIALNTKFIFEKSEQNLLFVSGADSSHFKSLCQLVQSILTHEPNSKIVIYDLGFDKKQTIYFKSTFPAIILREFNYVSYPSYFNIKKNAGEYAWKPVIIESILNEYKCDICWMDAGNIIIKPLDKIRKILNTVGFYSPLSQGKISNWTHPKTLELFNTTDKSTLKKKNLNGACVAASYDNLNARELIGSWSKYAQQKEYIAPEGSGRHNHRQDQALLSVLAHKLIPDTAECMTKSKFGFKIHQDID
jgi:hypothetical protein